VAVDSFFPPVVVSLLADSKEFNAKMDQAAGKVQAFGASTATMGTRMSGVWNKMSTAILGGAAAVVGISVDLALKYNEALDAMQRQTNLTDGQMAYLKKRILDVSTSTATAATTIVSGYQQLIKAGENLKQSTTDVGQAAKYANSMNADLTDTLTAALGIQKTHLAGTKNISQTLDIFTTAVKHSQMSATDLNSALGGRALSAFAAYHLDIRSAITLLAGFADQNLKGSKATMSLKTGIAALEKPATSSTGKLTVQALAIKSVGLNMTTLADEVRKPGGALQVLQQLSTAFDRNASSSMKAKGIAAWMATIFGSSAGPAFTNLIGELPKLMTLYGQMSTSGGAVNSSFSKWLASPAGAVAKFKTVLENSAIKLGDVLLPKLTVGLIDATKLITGVLDSPTKSKAVEDIGIALLGGALATKIVKLMLSAAGGLGVSAVTGASAAELAGTAAGVGFDTAAGIASFFATTTILKHNLFGLGTAVTNVANWINGPVKSGTTDFSGPLKKLLNEHGITNAATVSLSPSSIRYLQNLNKPGDGKTKSKISIKAKVTK
jgi:TP901 family phage tail tape measure protein